MDKGIDALLFFSQSCDIESFVKTFIYFDFVQGFWVFFSIHCNQFHLNLVTSSSLLFAWSGRQHLFRLERDALNFEGSLIFDTPAKPPTGFCGGFCTLTTVQPPTALSPRPCEGVAGAAKGHRNPNVPGSQEEMICGH